MPITMDIQESFLFKQGKAEGEAQGETKRTKADILSLYTKLNLTPEKIAEVLNVNTAFVVSTLEEAGFLKHN
jgi:hypothetical protein